MMIKKVRQKQKAGCGPACVAMLVGVDYYDVTTRFWWKDFNKYGTTTREVQYLLRQFGYTCPDKLIAFGKRDYHDLSQNAIFKVADHWVCWDAKRKVILDPDMWPERSYKPTSYLPVTKIVYTS